MILPNVLLKSLGCQWGTAKSLQGALGTEKTDRGQCYNRQSYSSWCKQENADDIWQHVGMYGMV